MPTKNRTPAPAGLMKPTAFAAALAAAIRERLCELGESAHEFADRAGIAYSTLMDTLAGLNAGGKVYNLLVVAHHLGVRPDELLRRAVTPAEGDPA